MRSLVGLSAWCAAASLVGCGGGGENPPPENDASVADAAVDGIAPDEGAEVDAPPGCAPGVPVDTPVDALKVPELALTSEPGAGLGVGDPSLWYPNGAASGALTYSAGSIDAMGYIHVDTHIATSADKGATFTYAASINATTPITFDSTDPSLCANDAGTCSVSGALIHETSTIVDDAADPNPQERFKVFFHSYVELLPAAAGKGNRFIIQLGYLGEQTAPAPAGPWSAERKVIGWNSTSSISSSGVTLNVNDVPALARCNAVGEPGAAITPSGLDLAVTCVDYSGGSQHIELLRSTDHGATWSHVGRILDGQWAPAACGTGNAFSGADLFYSGGSLYLSVVTGGPVPQQPNAYNACVVYRVGDVAKGLLDMGPGGSPVVLRRMLATPSRFFGPCTYAEGASAAGYLTMEQYPDAPPRILRTYATHVAAP